MEPGELDVIQEEGYEISHPSSEADKEKVEVDQEDPPEDINILGYPITGG